MVRFARKIPIYVSNELSSSIFNKMNCHFNIVLPQHKYKYIYIYILIMFLLQEIIIPY